MDAAIGAGHRPRRLPWPRFVARAALALAGVLAIGAYAADRFRIGIDDQVHRCLPPHRVFLIDRHDRALAAGEVFAFRATGMAPYFPEGAIVIKRAAGLPGARVRVGREVTQVEDRVVGEGLALARTLGRAAETFLRDEPVPPGHLWVMGDTADSFDSRYWGFLPERQVVGRAYALW